MFPGDAKEATQVEEFGPIQEEKAKFSSAVRPFLLRGIIWSTSNGCVETPAGLRQYSHRHCARSAISRLSLREGRLENI